VPDALLKIINYYRPGNFQRFISGVAMAAHRLMMSMDAHLLHLFSGRMFSGSFEEGGIPGAFIDIQLYRRSIWNGKE
jgi:hypothetical protein